MARTSDKDILTKLRNMEKNAKSLNQFKVAAKINMRIVNFKKSKKQKSLLEFK